MSETKNQRALRLFLEAVAELERAYIEGYGLEAYRKCLRNALDDYPDMHRLFEEAAADDVDPDAVREGLVRKFRQKMD
jgi:hypothetical protein